MDEEIKKAVGVFRFGIIGDFVNGGKLERGGYERLVREKSKRHYDIPGTHRTRISGSTIKHWIRRYEEGGNRLEALYPQEREDIGSIRGWDSETAATLVQLRKEMPRASIPRLMLEMQKRNHKGVPAMATVYRFLHRHELMKGVNQEAADRRRFEAECVNDLWQSDALHGPQVKEGGRYRKAYLLAIIDDHSRLITHGQFYLSEGLECYLDCLRQGLLKRGLPRKLYVDNGSAFRSRHLEQVTASLGISLIHSRVGEPEGRGKVERFFRTVRENFLGSCQAKDLTSLNHEFNCWINNWYHARRHSSTKEKPLDRFGSGLECIRRAPSDLEDYFRKEARRRVDKDRSISLNGQLYEAPVALVGKQVKLYYHEHDLDQIEVNYEKKSYGYLRPMDVHLNARVKRAPKASDGKSKPVKIEKAKIKAPSSGQLPLTVQGGSHE